jgi:MSHA biogenesis protein MshG
MANFKYKARDKFSRLISGEVSAENQDEAIKKLHELGYVPISIEKASGLRPENILEKFKRVSLDELNAFTRQLYALQKAGLPLLSSLSAISDQTKNQYFKTVVEDLLLDIKGGISLSESLKKHPRVFSDVYVSMVHVGETGGSMVEILERLSLLISQDMDTKSRIKAATRYPMIAFCVLCLGFTIIVGFVIPRFASVYNQFNALLPLPTRILIAVNVAITKFWYLFIIIVSALIFGFVRFIHTARGRAIWDNLKLKVPVFGPLVSLLTMSRFTRITAMLMKSGVPILEVLDLTAKTSGNIIISRAIENIRESVNQGKGMSEPMKLTGMFPSAVVQMVSVGEQTGKVDELLISVADYYDLESSYMIKNLTTYIEPILIFILAVMVLLMALAIFLPMWNLIKVFKPS